MRLHLRPWQLALAAVMLCCAVLAALLWQPNRPANSLDDARKLLSLLPASANDATIGYIDTKALRASSILDLIAGSKAAEEPDYRSFVQQTGFDYRTDLDRVAAAFLNDGSYFALEGRFQWKQLESYAASQGGACRAEFCTMPGSTEDRKISFYTVQANVLALAVTREPDGASHIRPSSAPGSSNNISRDATAAPVWFSWPSFSSLVTRLGSLPPVAQRFLAPLAQTRNITLSAGPADEKNDKQLRLRLEVTCASPDDAKQLLQELSIATTALKSAAAKPMNTAQLSGILAAGTFQQRGNILLGAWPFDRAFLEHLAGSGAE